MAFGQTKQNFEIGQFVRIGNMPVGNELNEMVGRIVGVYAIDDIIDYYIVLLTKKLSYTESIAIVMPEVCLEPFAVDKYSSCDWMTSFLKGSAVTSSTS